MKVTTEPFGELGGGLAVERFTLENGRGLRARVINYGATIISLEVPDRDGKIADIALGFDTLEGYLNNTPFFGSTVGRFANRIRGGRFEIDGVTYQLERNERERHHVHGGVRGFDKVFWDARPFEREGTVGVELSYLSPDGEEHYPGNLACRVACSVTDEDELVLEYTAETDRPTPVNLTNHTYFNLAGQDAGSMLEQELWINAERFTPDDKEYLPTGEIRGVGGTAMDFFSVPRAIGSQFDLMPAGYNVNYIVNRAGEGLALAARVREPRSGRVMEIRTTTPGMEFYTGSYLDYAPPGKGGAALPQFRRLLPGAPFLSRFAEPAALPKLYFTTGGTVSPGGKVQVLCGVMGGGGFEI